MTPAQRNIRTVAQLQRIVPQTGGEFSGRIISERVGNLWKSGYEINTPTASVISPVSGCTKFFESEYKAVYDAIRSIKSSLRSFKPDQRSFIVDICDVAFDNVNLTLFDGV